VINNPDNKALFDLRNDLMRRRPENDSLSIVRNMIRVLTEADLAITPPYRIPEAHREIYRTIGGAAHLDQNYTVFGQVVKGMEVVDSIAGVQTNRSDRPLEDVRIITARMIRRRDYQDQ
jgi:peptidyl-prolyl cis-trans isomerase B (cyclophilin B)